MKTNHAMLIVTVAATIATLACGQVVSEEQADAGADGDGGSGAGLDQFFSLAQIHTIDINVDAAGVAALLEAPRIYTPGAVTIDGDSYAQVGVRLKGQAGSFVALDGDYPEISQDGNGNPGKSAFIVDFNRYTSGQKHLGLTKLTINNMVQDDSGIHEYLGYALFRAGKVPAPRTGYAKVSFNGVAKGIYALIESPDNGEHLERWFGSATGNLYEGAYGTDLAADRWRDFDQDSGDDESMADLAALVAALEAVGDDSDPTSVLVRYFDLDQYTTFAATELFLGHWDGYTSSANNFMIYHDIDTDKWSFMPWGIDQIFENTMGEFAGVMGAPGPRWNEMGGRIHALCFRSPTCLGKLATAWAELLDRVDAMALAELADSAAALVGPHVLAEANAHGDPLMTSGAIAAISSFLDQRPAEVGHWLPCLSGSSVDSDSDGYDDCTVDCNPNAAEINPGADEQCNFIDDDCNGVRDDPAGCPRCLTTRAPDGVDYQLCYQGKSSIEAAAYCHAEGGELASIHDLATAEHVTFAFMDMIGVEASWIGLNDRSSEGDFVWSDGSIVDFTRMVDAEPSPERDCILNRPYGWMPQECDQPRAFICK